MEEAKRVFNNLPVCKPADFKAWTTDLGTFVTSDLSYISEKTLPDRSIHPKPFFKNGIVNLVRVKLQDRELYGIIRLSFLSSTSPLMGVSLKLFNVDTDILTIGYIRNMNLSLSESNGETFTSTRQAIDNIEVKKGFATSTLITSFGLDLVDRVGSPYFHIQDQQVLALAKFDLSNIKLIPVGATWKASLSIEDPLSFCLNVVKLDDKKEKAIFSIEGNSTNNTLFETVGSISALGTWKLSTTNDQLYFAHAVVPWAPSIYGSSADVLSCPFRFLLPKPLTIVKSNKCVRLTYNVVDLVLFSTLHIPFWIWRILRKQCRKPSKVPQKNSVRLQDIKIHE